MIDLAARFRKNVASLTRFEYMCPFYRSTLLSLAALHADLWHAQKCLGLESYFVSDKAVIAATRHCGSDHQPNPTGTVSRLVVVAIYSTQCRGVIGLFLPQPFFANSLGRVTISMETFPLLYTHRDE